MNPIENLTKLGLQLPAVSTPGGNYVSANIRGNIVYIAIQFPIRNGEFLFQGRLGDPLTTEQGYQAMQLCALNVLAHVRQKTGFERIEGLNHIDAYFQSAEHWDDAPKAANGASDLFVRVLEEKGLHSRAIVGVHKLPRNFCAGLCASFTLKTM